MAKTRDKEGRQTRRERETNDGLDPISRANEGGWVRDSTAASGRAGARSHIIPRRRYASSWLDGWGGRGGKKWMKRPDCIGERENRDRVIEAVSREEGTGREEGLQLFTRKHNQLSLLTLHAPIRGIMDISSGQGLSQDLVQG